MAAYSGEPIHLVKQIENTEDNDVRFELNPEVFNRMSSIEKLLKTKVAIISVAGAFRKGKSFLLNFILKYFTALASRRSQSWIQEQSLMTNGFHWRAGSQRDTTGILIWSEPFFIRKPNGEEVAVLLMDTQGTFDHQSTQKDCATIFGFSTLLSSVQIFNISQNIQESDLQHLRLFVEFAAMARNSKEKVLQHLWFLVRDWQNPDEYEYGTRGGKKYLSTVLACDSQKPKENQELRQGIRQHFEQAFCCLLPHPGLVVTKSNYNGEVGLLEDEFTRELEQFIPAIASPEEIRVKKINGRELSGKEMIGSLEVYFKAFSDGRMPTPRSIFSATVEMANMAAAEEAKKFFESSMKSLDSKELTDSEFSQVLSETQQQAVQLFAEKCMEPDSSATRNTMKKLQEEMQDIAQRQNVLRQVHSQKVSADKKNAMLQEEIGSLHQQNLAVQWQMEQMEDDYKMNMEEIRKKSISKEEMERLIKEESMRHATATKEMELKNERLMEKVDEMLSANLRLQEDSRKQAERHERERERLAQESMAYRAQ